MVNETLNLVLLNAGHAVHHADWNFRGIKSPFARIYYVTSGSAVLRCDKGAFELKPRCLYLVPPFMLHSDECDGDFSLYYLHIYFGPSGDVGIFEQYDLPFEVPATHWDLMLVERLMELNPDRQLKRYDPQAYDNSATLLENISQSAHASIGKSVETQGLLLQLFSRFLAVARHKLKATDKRVLVALAYINEHIREELPIGRLAQQAFLTPDHFIRLFKKEMGYTPMAYIIEKRIEQAQSLLIFSNWPVKEIAIHLSFENISYFSRLFKRQTGQTPQEYRRSVALR